MGSYYSTYSTKSNSQKYDEYNNPKEQQKVAMKNRGEFNVLIEDVRKCRERVLMQNNKDRADKSVSDLVSTVESLR